MKKQLARYGAIFMTALLLAACGGGERTVSADASAEIPEEILGELDEETLQELVEEPKMCIRDRPRSASASRRRNRPLC